MVIKADEGVRDEEGCQEKNEVLSRRNAGDRETLVLWLRKVMLYRDMVKYHTGLLLSQVCMDAKLSSMFR